METSRLINSRDTQLWLLSNQSNNSHNKSNQKHRLKVIPSLTVKKTLMIVILRRNGRLVKRAQIVTLVIPMIFTIQD